MFKRICKNLSHKPITLVHTKVRYCKAYVQGMCSKEFGSVMTSVHAAVFLSSPYHGAKLAEVLNRILSVSIFGHSSRRYITELEANSKSISEMNESFRSFIHNLDIFSFYELEPTPITRFISVVCRTIPGLIFNMADSS